MASRASVRGIIQKLLTAIQYKHGRRLTYHTQQFYGQEGSVHTLYMVKEAVWDEQKSKYINKDLYRTASTIRLALWLRDYYYRLEGIELPTDNEIWNKIRDKEDFVDGQYRSEEQ